MIIEEEDYLAHYGVLRRSGRYPWGSGGNEPQSDDEFNAGLLGHIKDMKKQGMTDTEIAKGLGITTTEYRKLRSVAINSKKQADIAMVQRLKDKGNSPAAISERTGIPSRTVYALLQQGEQRKVDVLGATSDMLREQVDQKTYIDVGLGVEHHVPVAVGVSKEKLAAAVKILEEEGYVVHPLNVKQLGTGKDTRLKVLCPPGTTQKQLWEDNRTGNKLVQQITAYSTDGGLKYNHIKPPLPINPKRVAVNWKEDGGGEADGVIFVRPGVDDLSLGGKRYAQVRIQVGPDHYLKGMAIHKDGLPEGVDLVFNTPKPRTKNKLDAMKPLEEDPDLPFGSVIKRQILSEDGSKPTSVMNIINEEGGWLTWSNTIASQVLSKQSPALAKEQLNITYGTRKQDFDEILALTNPTVKRKLLETFAEETDSSAVMLDAAKLKRQSWHVILPIPTMKPNEVYAPRYRDGEKVVLIRYPHAGPFEIPELTVNNRHRDAKRIIGNSPDAIGIHHSVAEHLSGADFDGDAVLVIPNNSKRIKHVPPLEKLKGFDPVAAYPEYPGMEVMDKRRLQQEMGDISNLITDMTIRGAPHSDIVRAVRHSMVVIDAKKKKLNYRQSAEDNGIRALKQQYQGKTNAGASTLISRATAQAHVNQRKQGFRTDPITGDKIYVETGKMRQVTKRDPITGKRVPTGEMERVTQRSTKLAETNDAHTLIDEPGTQIERVYADHSNKLKELARQARLEAQRTPSLQRSPSAAKHYAKEVASLDAQLRVALRNAPLERQAQVLANEVVRAKRAANPNMDDDVRKKVEYQALQEARARTGAGKTQIHISPEEWNAIQAGAISNSKLMSILRNADIDVVKEMATPREKRLMTHEKTSRAKDMLLAGYTRSQVADQLGVSLSTLDRSMTSSGQGGE